MAPVRDVQSGLDAGDTASTHQHRSAHRLAVAVGRSWVGSAVRAAEEKKPAKGKEEKKPAKKKGKAAAEEKK